MTDKPSIFDALTAVMAEVRGVAKREKNTAPGQNYNFRGIDAVINAVGPALRNHGVIVVPSILTYEYGSIEAGKARTPMGHARVTVNYRWYGPNGDYIDTSAPGEAMDSGDKATAKAMSVAFRTTILQALALPTDERDPDADTYERSPARPSVPAPRSPQPSTPFSAKKSNPQHLERVNQMLGTAASMEDIQAAQLVINAEWASTIVPEREQMLKWVELAQFRIEQAAAATNTQEQLSMAGAA